MLPAAILRQIGAACRTIGNEATDESGFIPVRMLLRRFQATLLFRPLLVEGILATQTSPQGSANWLVLIDSETYSVADTQLANESRSSPLPVRLRNTIAHELVHSIAFRPAEFGVQPLLAAHKQFSRREYVRAVEEQTEHLSPLLLWSEKSLKHTLQDYKRTASVQQLNDLRQRIGISRDVLISRLTLLPIDDLLRRSAALKNLAIGIGESTSTGIVLRSWPTFLNFDHNVAPSFLWRLRRQDRMPIDAILAAEDKPLSFEHKDSVSFRTKGGPAGVPDAEEMTVMLALEPFTNRGARRFLFVVHKLSD